MALGGKRITWFDGKWHEGDEPVISANDHAAWLSSSVFDGARWFDGVMPDLDLHCRRLIRSAEAFGMAPSTTAGKLLEISIDGVERIGPGDTALYIRPMMWARDGSAGIIDPDPESTVCAVCIEEAPMTLPPEYSLTVAPFRRPRQDMAMTEAKCGSLYPNNGRIAKYARDKGFDNALSLDIDDNVAETSSTNIFAVHGDTVSTPEPTGCFLAGITRQRIIGLLRDAGVEVLERAMSVEDFEKADEIFTTGNYSKVVPVTRFEDRDVAAGKYGKMARDLYMEFAHSQDTPAAKASA